MRTIRKVGKNENKIVVEGVKYKAHTSDGCGGCAFNTIYSCPKTTSDTEWKGAVGEIKSSLCHLARKDSRSIIWIKVE